MTLVVCTFTGWMQVRLATNPDPTDEPRGVSGYTFALPGEPDFDRVVRSSNPIAPRSHGRQIGVTVNRVQIDGIGIDTHPLVGAQLDLVGPARFESVNEIVMAQGTQVLEPFEVALSKGAFRLQRRSYLDPSKPDLTVYTAPRELIEARAASMAYSTDLMQEAAGCTDPAEFRRARLALLEADFAKATDPTERAALARRISELKIDDPGDRRFYSMKFVERRHFDLNGPTTLADPDRWLATLDDTTTFGCDIVMGCWDVDALSMYTTGSLSLPTR